MEREPWIPPKRLQKLIKCHFKTYDFIFTYIFYLHSYCFIIDAISNMLAYKKNMWPVYMCFFCFCFVLFFGGGCSDESLVWYADNLCIFIYILHFMSLFLESENNYFPLILALRNSLWHVSCGQMEMSVYFMCYEGLYVELSCGSWRVSAYSGEIL